MEFKFKNDEVKSPLMYLRAKLEYQVYTGIMCWTISSEKYINILIENIEKMVKCKV
jgi:hypothetical protein